MALLLGYDVGSSSIKATLLESDNGEILASATSPNKELEIIAKQLGWAEQQPQTWWDHVKAATEKKDEKETSKNLYYQRAQGNTCSAIPAMPTQPEIAEYRYQVCG